MYHAGRRGAGSAFSTAGALAVTALAMAMWLTFTWAAAMVGATVATALVVGQLAMAAMTMAMARAVRGGRAAVGLVAPPGLVVMGAALVGSSLWFISLVVVSQLPLPESTPLGEMIEQPPLLTTLIAFALVPACCEELVFRGVLARSLAVRHSRPFAILLSALLFSGYHFSVVQMIPTAILGCALAYIALCADSILPTIVAHLLNNTCAIVLSRGDAPGVANAIDAHPYVTLGVMIALTATGLTLATLGRRPPGVLASRGS